MPRQQKGGAQKKQADADYEEPKPKVRKLTVTHHGGNKAGAGAIPVVHDTADIKELEERRRQTLEQLRQVELGIYNLETQYFEMANPQGNALKGYEGLLSSSSSAKKAQLKDSDRIFSGSSVTGTLHLHQAPY